METSVKHHYDLLIEEDNDPVQDSVYVQEYMNKWDGHAFIEKLMLTGTENVLEIGVGTGRLARMVCGNCGSFVGIDISPKTINKAKVYLAEYKNIELICIDFIEYDNENVFDVVYSSLTFMHIKDKQTAMNKVAALIKTGGRFVLSISNSQSNIIDYGTREVKIYPDNPADTIMYLDKAGMELLDSFNTEFATIIVAEKVI